ncbi:unnamed protein product [Mytilus edulis]|uniref:CUB domain-containing protein n=1 Tax=Mytilus edulis TaxID=6550 RepID=A0A8S3T0B7_MYTED|nr:unnamed protein product [Mytilus edulis]
MYVLFTTDISIAAEGFRVSYILQGAPTSTVSTTVQVAANKQHVENAENDKQNSELSKSETTKIIPKHNEHGLLDIEEIIYSGKLKMSTKLYEENYEERIENLKNIYHAHTKHGHDDRNIARARSQIDYEMQQRPTAVREYPLLVQPKNNSIEIKAINK